MSTNLYKNFTCLLTLALVLAFTLPAFAAGSKNITDKNRVEVVFVLDTTGSMANLIDGAKKKIWSIANSIIDQDPEAEVLMGLVAYRDIGDEYVTKVFPLTTDIQGIYADLLTFKANGGGDTPESVNEALDVAVTKMGWTSANKSNSAKVTRIIFLVGDAPPHMDYGQDRKYPEVIKEARSKNIVVNTVQAGNSGSTMKVWKEMAQMGEGDYHRIPQDGGRVVIIETPYDEEIHLLQIKINKTVIPYGSRMQQEEVSKKTKMYESRSAASADMSAFVNKSGKGAKVVTGYGDLVNDVLTAKKDLAKLDKSELPADLQGMSTSELDSFIKKQQKEREVSAGELKKLAVKREAFIREQEEKAASPAKTDNFDKSVSETIKKQMK